MVVREVNEGVFVQDRDGRVLETNKAFIDLLDLAPLDEAIMRYKTFGQVAEALPAERPELAGLQELLRKLQHVDEVGQEGGVVTMYRSRRGRGEVLIERRRRKFGPDGKNEYILGICRPAFWNTASEVLDKLPQYVSIKHYSPDAKVGRRFRVVWGNIAYLRRHCKRVEGLEDLARREIYDSDLWPKSQAKLFAGVDQRVMDAAITLETTPQYQAASAHDRWQLLTAELAKCDAHEFQEESIDYEGQKLVFQTTKWPEKIGDEWYLVVAYSDITVADAEKEGYHKMTVHAIRNAAVSYGGAENELLNYSSAANQTERDDIVAKASRLLRVGSVSLSHVADTHLKLMHLDVKKDWTALERVVDCARKQFEETKLLNPDFVRDTSFEDMVPIRPELQKLVLVDLDFLKHVLAELLRNARKSVDARNETTRNWREKKLGDDDFKEKYGENWNDQFEPFIGLRLTEEPRYLSLAIIDNGEAAARTEVWEDLKKSLDAPLASGNWRTLGKLGVQFCRVVCARLNGELRIEKSHNNAMKVVKVVVRLRRMEYLVSGPRAISPSEVLK